MATNAKWKGLESSNDSAMHFCNVYNISYLCAAAPWQAVADVAQRRARALLAEVRTQESDLGKMQVGHGDVGASVSTHTLAPSAADGHLPGCCMLCVNLDPPYQYCMLCVNLDSPF